MNTFADFCRACGVIPPEGIERGRWIRCATVTHPRKKNSSIKLSDDGRIGWVHDFATMSEPETWRPDKEAVPAARIDHREIAARESERRRELVRATYAAREYYNKSSPLLGGHPYLSSKGLDMTGCQGLRVDTKDWLVVPMMYRGSLISIQRISDRGDKLFWSGGTTKKTSFWITRKKFTITLLCEGLATGLSLFASVPDSQVVVAFNAGNLPLVAEEIKGETCGLCAICADNDRGTAAKIGKNPGLEAAQKAAGILGAGVAVPECEEGTDFNDLVEERMRKEREDNMFRKGRKWTDAQMLQNARATVRSAVMSACKFIPFKSNQFPL